jgi:hypothetical protein
MENKQQQQQTTPKLTPTVNLVESTPLTIDCSNLVKEEIEFEKEEIMSEESMDNDEIIKEEAILNGGGKYVTLEEVRSTESEQIDLNCIGDEITIDYATNFSEAIVEMEYEGYQPIFNTYSKCQSGDGRIRTTMLFVRTK